MTEQELEDFVCAMAVVAGLVVGLWLGCVFVNWLSSGWDLLKSPVGRTARSGLGWILMDKLQGVRLV